MTHTSSTDQHDPRNDGELFAASLQDNAPFRVIFERHVAAVESWLTRQGVPEDVRRDLVAETCAVAWEQRAKFDQTKDDARPWLFGIASNLRASWMRSHYAEADARQRLGMNTDYSSEVAEQHSHGTELTQSAMSLLDPLTQQIVVMRVEEDLSFREIARRLQCSAPMARMRMMRAMRTLRTELEQKDQT